MLIEDTSEETFMVTDAVIPLPSAAVAIIVVFPYPFTVTVQLPSLWSSTVATFVFADFHKTIWEASSGLFFTHNVTVLLSVSGFTPMVSPLIGRFISFAL